MDLSRNTMIVYLKTVCDPVMWSFINSRLGIDTWIIKIDSTRGAVIIVIIRCKHRNAIRLKRFNGKRFIGINSSFIRKDFFIIRFGFFHRFLLILRSSDCRHASGRYGDLRIRNSFRLRRNLFILGFRIGNNDFFLCIVLFIRCCNSFGLFDCFCRCFFYAFCRVLNSSCLFGIVYCTVFFRSFYDFRAFVLRLCFCIRRSRFLLFIIRNCEI